MAKRTKTTRLLGNMREKHRFEPKVKLAGNFYLPNQSGDHSKSHVRTQPTQDLEIANKKYVDDNDHDSVTVTDTVSVDLTLTTQDIKADVLPAGVDHDLLLNFVSNEHIDHTGVTLIAGVGLSGGGDISSNRTFTVDLNELGTETTIASGDFIAMVDITDNGSQKITFANLESSLNHDSLLGFAANEHLDWTADQGATNISTTNIPHNIDFHDTTATGANLTTLTDDSITDTLHRHSELSIGSLNRALYLDSQGNINIPNCSRFSASRANTQSINNSTWTTIVFDTEEYDTLDEYEVGDGIFTATVAGFYLCMWQIEFDSAAWTIGELKGSRVLKNNSATDGNEFQGYVEEVEASNTSNMTTGGHTIVELAANDTLRVQGFQNFGSALNIRANRKGNYWQVHKLS